MEQQNNNNQERTSKLRNFLEKVKTEVTQVLLGLEEITTALPNPTRNALLETLYQYQRDLENNDSTKEITFLEETLRITNKIKSAQTALGLSLLLQEVERKLK